MAKPRKRKLSVFAKYKQDWFIQFCEKRLKRAAWQDYEIGLLLALHRAGGELPPFHLLNTVTVEARRGVAAFWRKIETELDGDSSGGSDPFDGHPFDDWYQITKGEVGDAIALHELPVLSNGKIRVEDALAWLIKVGFDAPQEWCEIAKHATEIGPRPAQTVQVPLAEPASQKPVVPKRSLDIAKRIGASDWGDIEVQVSGEGLRARKVGCSSPWSPARRYYTWEKLALRPTINTRYFKILMDLCAGKGQAPREKGKSYNQSLHDLNEKMRCAFGLSSPVFTVDGATTISRFAALEMLGR